MTGLSSRQPGLLRRPVGFNADLEKSLAAYAGAAAAAGVSFLAMTNSADAKIVYTPAHTKIPHGRVGVPIDLNHDGITDFSFVSYYGLEVSAVGNNQVWGRGTGSGRFASALPAGRKIGPDKTYLGKGTGFMAAWGYSTYMNSSTASFGQWNFTRGRYVGLKFAINGQIHYGWARVDVPSIHPAVLTGYAYETIPKKPIIAGNTKGPDAITLDAASLGKLAVGASQLAAWRNQKK